MKEPDYYYVIEKRDFQIVDLHRINVGVRHIGLNAQVRSMLAYGNFERDRVLARKEDISKRAFRVLTTGQYQAVLANDESLADFVADRLMAGRTASTNHERPKAFYAHIGYDPKRKRYTQSV